MQWETFSSDEFSHPLRVLSLPYRVGHARSKAEARPHSARVLRTLPSESPQFYMVNAHNPSFPTMAPTTRPTRPSSARSHTSSSGGSRNALDANQSPRMNQQVSSSSRANLGLRRKRNGGESAVHTRVRAIYHDIGRASPPVRQMPSSMSANSTIASKLKVFQQAELHDEYYKLVDVVTELKSACQHEQERRVKAVARIRRLEEIVAMKDRKIEALLQAKSGGSEHNHLAGAATQREMAQRDRQDNAMLQKSRHRIAQQSQVICSYEDAMQSLRSGIKSTNLMELEEERNQLYIELRHYQEELASQRLEIESQSKQIAELAQIDISHRQQITKTQQENKRCALEKQKVDQELAFVRARADQLQNKLVLEQRKRPHDREAASSVPSSPSRSSVLATTLDEMKAGVKKECAASIRHESLKSPRSSPKPSPHQSATVAGSTPSLATTTASSARPPLRQVRPQTRPHRLGVVASTDGSQSADPEAAHPVVTAAACRRFIMQTESATLPSDKRVGAPQSRALPSGAESVEGGKGDAVSSQVKIKPIESNTDETTDGEPNEIASGLHDSEKEHSLAGLASALAEDDECEPGTSKDTERLPVRTAHEDVQEDREQEETEASAVAKELQQSVASLLGAYEESSGSDCPAELPPTRNSAGENRQRSDSETSSDSEPSLNLSSDTARSHSSSADGDEEARRAVLDLDARAATMALELHELGLLKTNSQDSVLNFPTADSMYDSDFTENENDENDVDEESG